MPSSCLSPTVAKEVKEGEKKRREEEERRSESDSSASAGPLEDCEQEEDEDEDAYTTPLPPEAEPSKAAGASATSLASVSLEWSSAAGAGAATGERERSSRFCPTGAGSAGRGRGSPERAELGKSDVDRLVYERLVASYPERCDTNKRLHQFSKPAAGTCPGEAETSATLTHGWAILDWLGCSPIKCQQLLCCSADAAGCTAAGACGGQSRARRSSQGVAADSLEVPAGRSLSRPVPRHHDKAESMLDGLPEASDPLLSVPLPLSMPARHRA